MLGSSAVRAYGFVIAFLNGVVVNRKQSEKKTYYSCIRYLEIQKSVRPVDELPSLHICFAHYRAATGRLSSKILRRLGFLLTANAVELIRVGRAKLRSIQTVRLVSTCAYEYIEKQRVFIHKR